MPPPPSPIFEKKVHENQVSYFIWPKDKRHEETDKLCQTENDARFEANA